MSSDITVRAWKDPTFRETLPGEALAQLPQHPAGSLDEACDQAILMPTNVGGAGTTWIMAIEMFDKAFSVVGCPTTMWHGTCGASTLGCCLADS